MSDTVTIWVPDEDQEKEILELRARVTKLEHAVLVWKGRWRKERDRRLNLDWDGRDSPWQPRRPRLYTIVRDDLSETEEWLYSTDVITEALDVPGRNFCHWLKWGVIPDSDYRTTDRRRLWTREQVLLILEVVERHRGRGKNREGKHFTVEGLRDEIREELHSRWVRPADVTPYPCRRKRRHPDPGAAELVEIRRPQRRMTDFIEEVERGKAGR